MLKLTYNFIFVCCLSVSFMTCGQKPSTTAPETITYKKIDTITLKLYQYNPADFDKDKVYKAMILFHGGGWNAGHPKDLERQAMYFASRGLMTFTASYRLHNTHGTTPFEAVKDAKSAIRYVRQHAEELQVIPDAIIACGGSAGGHMAAAAGNIAGLEEAGEDLTVSSVPNVLVLYNPVFDNSPDGYGFDRMQGRYLEISPLHNITKGAPPTLVMLGTDDRLVPVATAERYKVKMDSVGSRCDVKLYEGQHHAFFNRIPEYFIKTTYDSDVFLQSLGYLEGKPTVKEQYGE